MFVHTNIMKLTKSKSVNVCFVLDSAVSTRRKAITIVLNFISMLFAWCPSCLRLCPFSVNTMLRRGTLCGVPQNGC